MWMNTKASQSELEDVEEQSGSLSRAFELIDKRFMKAARSVMEFER